MNTSTARSLACPPGHICMGEPHKGPTNFLDQGDHIRYSDSDGSEGLLLKDIEIAQTPIGAAPFLGHEDDGGPSFLSCEGTRLLLD